MERKKISRSLAIFISLMAVLSVFSVFIILLFWEGQIIYQKVPLLIQKTKSTLPAIQDWLTTTFGWTSENQLAWLAKSIESLPGYISNFVNASVTASLSFLFNLIMIPVFAVLILFNREQYVKGLGALLPKELQLKLPAILHEAINTFFNYIIGMGKVYLIVGILNTIGLMLLGIENAWLYGMIAAVMTIIPYLGIMLSALIPMSIAWLTKDSFWVAGGVVIVFAVVQYLEANIIFPKVVGTQLNLNTLASLLAILFGGLIWGVTGMILFLPFIAIIQIISKEIPGWEAITYLLSNKKG